MMLYRRCTCPLDGDCAHPWHYKFQHEGRRYRGSTRMTSQHKAELVAGKKRTAAVDGTAGLTPKTAPRLSVHTAAYQRWADSDHPATAETKDAVVLARLLAFVGDRRIDQISAFDLERFRSDRAKTVSRATADREFHIVRGCFRQAVRWGHLKASPCVKVGAWVLEQKRRRVLSPEELKIALTGLPPRYALMCRVTLECLPRLAEVLSLTRADIGPDWLQRRLKGGRQLRVQITPELAADLRAACATPAQVHVFGDPPPRQEATSSYFTRLFRGLGLKGVSHHSMRHTGVTLMLDAGRNPQAIQKLAGWTSLRMLEQYGHVRDAELVKAVEGNAAYLQAVLG